MEPSVAITKTPLALSDAVAKVNAELETFFTEYTEQAEAMHPAYGQLWQNIRELSMSGGKRLRPYLTLFAYQAYSSELVELIVPVAASQELLHFAMLVHDDIIDRDTVRYGTANITARYDSLYRSSLDSPTEVRHFANSAALMAGDICLSAAFELSTRASLSPEQHMQVRHALWQTLFTVVGGELLDTEAAFRTDKGMVADTETVNHFKTADYTCVKPLRLGAMLAQASDTELRLLEQIGLNLGMAFQLVDDNLGMYGDSAVTGKPVGADIREGKRTYIVEQATMRANNEERQRLEQLHGKHDITEQEIAEFRALVAATGANEHVNEQIAHYRTTADSAIELLSLPPEFKAQFHEIVRLIVERKA